MYVPEDLHAITARLTDRLWEDSILASLASLRNCSLFFRVYGFESSRSNQQKDFVFSDHFTTNCFDLPAGF